MSSTLLEVTRAAHEDVERLERLIVKDLQNDPPTTKDGLYQSHRVRNNIDTIISTTEKLVEIYDDKDNARKDEIAALGGQTATGVNVFSAFYDRLKEIREYHRKHPAARVVDANEEYEDLLKEEPVIEQYRKYMENLLEYLIYFFQRTEPLQDLDRIFSKALAVLGLKTGGTVQQRAERLLLTKHTPLEKLDKKHFAKGSHGPQQNGSTAVSQDINSLKQIALVEAKMKKLCDLLSKTIEQTKENVVKKQALTYEEMEQERQEFTNLCPQHPVRMAEETQVDTESDDEDQQIYNPLKLPMGWDGKPIPYWLYKLHGLGQEFKCEICGNYSYWGRRAFERHFKEWRHQHGMRCLGIPNTKNFNEITNIQEAQELWEKIRERQGVNKWRPDLEEEYEDKEGNIYNKKTYTDLQRQGLI
ncbi:Sf3a3 [Gossypium arboreum]|uniref:Sf3a3 n=1 Tax=Gossypium arboreum TaxID=29729 RepID=A0A0B0N411_GOSAR|nr:Sf3a3 [Gossypium arboreum]